VQIVREIRKYFRVPQNVPVRNRATGAFPAAVALK